ncbi:MAG: M23 family metallopeptidase [candidate division WOR-3 bacterium]|nr:M23 family metallopeptidase [candidate division WOR-3 bacterium]MCR4424059.1 M23 family metallopeptidase [candidate division WOR-3 bacterium]MDH7519522.1 M23 family metallopeptidase [bacterium]
MERLQVLVHLTRRNKALTVSFPIYYIYVAVAVIFGFFVFSGAFTRFVVNRFTDRGLLNHLIAENSRLSKQLTAYAAAVDSFRQFLAFTEQMDNKLRAAVNLGLVPADVRLMGIGGNQPPTPAPEVDELLRRAKFTQRSLLEIDRAVTKEQERLKCTPSIWPVQGWVTSGFGYRQDPFTGKREMHAGMDIVAPRGTPIVATADGKVVYAGWKSGFGKTVEIDHGWGIRTFYGHCNTIRVAVGKRVKRGEVIATVGATGQATGNHLHYGVTVNGNWVNPADYILSGRGR